MHLGTFLTRKGFFSLSRKLSAASIYVGNLVALSAYALVIWPVLRSGFIQDDRFDVIWGELRHEFSLDAVSDGIRWTDIYVHSLGRFHPLAHLIGSISFEISDRETFKLLQFCLVLTIAAVFLHLLNVWTGDRRTGPMAILILATVSQFRTDFDPILSFGVHTKVLLLILLLQLVVVERISRKPDQRVHLMAMLVVLVLCAALYHEIAVICTMGLVLISGELDDRDTKFVRRLLVWVFLAYVTLRMRMYLTTSSDIAMPYYQLSIDPLVVIISFLKQLSGLLPLVSTSAWGISRMPSFSLILLLLLLASTSLALIVRSTSAESSRSFSFKVRRRWSASLLFIWWIVGSAAVVSLSAGHQEWSSWGGGYINIWVAQMALSGATGIAVTACLDKLESRRSILVMGMAVGVAVLASLTARVNSVIVDANPGWQANTQINGWEREQTLRAIDAGLLNGIDPSETLVASPPRPWMNESFIRLISGNTNLKLANSWARFAEMPVSWPSDCVLSRLRNKDQGSRDAEHLIECLGSRTKVITSFATDYQNGYSLFATLSRLSVAANPQIEQNRRNSESSLVQDLRFFGYGRFASCSSLSGVSSTGDPVRIPISGTTVRASYGQQSTVVIRLKSIVPKDCS